MFVVFVINGEDKIFSKFRQYCLLIDRSVYVGDIARNIVDSLLKDFEEHTFVGSCGVTVAVKNGSMVSGIELLKFGNIKYDHIMLDGMIFRMVDNFDIIDDE